MAKQSVDLQHCKSGGVRGIQRHCQREPGENHSNKDIDDSRTHLNYDLHNDEKISFTDKVNERIKEGYTGTRKIQSNANVMECLVLQAKKEFFDNLTPEKEREFFQTAYEHVCDKYGKENVVSAIVHKDEKAPHLHINFVPLKDGRLCSADLFRKQQMIDLHTDMHRALKERGFDIERGENELEKREHLTPQAYKLKEMERQVAELEKKIPEKQQSLAIKEAELNKRVVEISRIAITDNKVKAIAETAKDKKTMFGGNTGEVVLPKEEFEKLIASATIGAVAREENTNLHKRIETITADKKGLQEKVDIARGENLSLIGENMQLKQKIDSYDKLMNDRQVKERVYDIQNPHLAAYREIKKETPHVFPFGENKNHPERYADISYKMLTQGFSRDQTMEALRNDHLDRDKALTALSGAGARITEERVQAEALAKVEQARLQAEQARAHALAEQQRKVAEHKAYLDKNPHIKKYDQYKARGMNDATIAFTMMKVDKIPSYKVEQAFKFDKPEADKGYAERVTKVAKDYKLPPKAERTRSYGGSSSGALLTSTKSFLDSLGSPGSTSPSVGGGMGNVDIFGLSDDELEEIEKAMERKGMSFER